MPACRLGVSALTLLSLAACAGGDTPAPDDGPIAPFDGTPIQLTRFRADSFAYAFFSGLRTPEHFIIRDAAAWEDLWQRIHATMTPAPDLPSVDFGREMVVASALGNRNSGGYDVLFTGASEEGGTVRVGVTESSPGTTCATTSALTQPVDLATMPLKDGPVEFVVTRRVHQCSP